MNNNLPFEHYIELNIDYSKVVNSTLDIEKDSILCIDLNNIEKLDARLQTCFTEIYYNMYNITM